MKEHSCQHAAEPCTRKVPIFAALTDEDLTRISAMIKHRKFTKGQPLILEGAPSDTLYIIQQGHVKLSKITPRREGTDFTHPDERRFLRGTQYF